MPTIVSREKWLEQRLQHLVDEKEFTRARDALSAKRRQLPWVLLEQDYLFEGESGQVRLSELFGGHSQLIIYHFMYGEDWEAGCPSCSFWADNFNTIGAHLGARDAGFAAISIAPIEQLAKYKRRMGWEFTWVSSKGNSFNKDFAVSFSDEERSRGKANYNFNTATFPSSEAPGISIFVRGENTEIYHTYSTFGRGLDMLNGTYHYMDLLPKGRDEEVLDYPQQWIRRRGDY